MKDKRLVSLFYFNIGFVGKDMFLVPKYLSDYLGIQGEVVYPKGNDNADFKGEYRGMKLTPIRSGSKFYSTFWSEKEMAWWLIKNARNIDVLCLFWLNQRNIIFAKIYKIINPKGVCYVKGDLGYTDFSKFSNKGFKYYFKKNFLNAVDVHSVETQINFDAIEKGYLGEHLSKSTLFMSNGFDVKLFKELNIIKREFNDKENLVITVGRIGHNEKNNEMMLAALEGVDMKDWKFMLVGSIEEHFFKIYDDFISRNPDKKEKVLLIGPVYDRKELWEIYNRAKVFLLTSPKEGFPIVYSEALAFGNYIITTNVSGSREISENGQIGKVIDVGDVASLRKSLFEIFESKIDLKTNYSKAINLADSKFNWEKLVEIVGERINEIFKSN